MYRQASISPFFPFGIFPVQLEAHVPEVLSIPRWSSMRRSVLLPNVDLAIENSDLAKGFFPLFVRLGAPDIERTLHLFSPETGKEYL